MDSKSMQRIKLPDVLNILEGPVTSDSPTIFINPEGSLETFFTYKGSLVEVGKMEIKLKLGTKAEEISEQVRGNIVSGLQRGEWVVFNAACNSNFNFAGFFKQLAFNQGDTDFFKNSKLMDKEYLKKKGILQEAEDKDFFGNQGYYKVNEKARVFYLCTCNESEIASLISANSGINFDYIIVE